MLDELLDMIIEDALERMGKTLKAFETKLHGVRAGRAAPMMLMDVRVNAYGRSQPLSHVASISAPQADLLVVQPWDSSTMAHIERAIRTANLGLNPSNDGTLIRVPGPPLTEERRLDLVKQTRRLGEEAKVALRNIRRQANRDVKETQEEEKLSEDMRYVAEERLQNHTNSAVSKVGEMLKRKEAAILEV